VEEDLSRGVVVQEINRRDGVTTYSVETKYGGPVLVRLNQATEPWDLRCVMPSGKEFETTLVSRASDEERGGEQEARETLDMLAKFVIRCFAQENRGLN